MRLMWHRILNNLGLQSLINLFNLKAILEKKTLWTIFQNKMCEDLMILIQVWHFV